MSARSLDYVRSYYGIMVKRGDRVTVHGKPGRVTSGDGLYVRVRLDHPPHRSLSCHPKDLVFSPDTEGGNQ